MTGSTSEIVRVSYQEAYDDGYEDMQRRVPDCTLARQLVGFQATHSLDDILRSVIAERTAAARLTA